MRTITHTRGFTLLEIMVAVTIFSVAMIVGVGAILSMNDANRRARATQSTMDNLSFAIESLVREMRLGISYSCGISIVPGDCAVEGAPSVTFTNSEGNRVAYRISQDRLERSVYAGAGGVSETYEVLTSPDIKIEKFVVYIDGAPAGDRKQPRAIVSIRGSMKVDTEQSFPFTVQTMVTQRNVDS